MFCTDFYEFWKPFIEIEQSGYVTAALRHLHAAQTAAADESRVTAKQLSAQQQVFVAFNIVILVQFVIKYMTYVLLYHVNKQCQYLMN